MTTSLAQRAAGLLDLLAGRVRYADYFGDGFKAAVSEEQFNAITASLIAQYGQPVAIAAIEPQSESSGIVKVRFDKSIGSFALQIGKAPDNRVAGLRALGFTMTDDSFARVAAEIAALPGQSGFLVAEIDGVTITPLASANADRQFAIGSVFKLYVLDELAAQVAAGERRWDDVVPLTHRSFSSAGTANWPLGTPVTLQTLANWMVSVSDNAAADTLIHLLGREKIAARMRASGHSDPSRNIPFLTTVEAFALKGNNFNELRADFIGENDAAQRNLITSNQDRLTLANVDGVSLQGGPRFIDSLEWFASPDDIARLMVDIKAMDSEQAMAALAINNGVGPAAAADWSYLGYKGGSENGVLSMTLLGQRKTDGKWLVVTASWNNPEANVATETMLGLVTRLLALAAE